MSSIEETFRATQAPEELPTLFLRVPCQSDTTKTLIIEVTKASPCYPLSSRPLEKEAVKETYYDHSALLYHCVGVQDQEHPVVGQRARGLSARVWRSRDYLAKTHVYAGSKCKLECETSIPQISGKNAEP